MTNSVSPQPLCPTIRSGRKPSVAQPAADFGDRGAGMNGAVDFRRIGMAVDGAALVLGVGDLAHPRHGVLVRLGDEVDLVARLLARWRTTCRYWAGKF